MDTETKLLLGKILGEVYRLQKHSPDCSCPVGDDQIYGLLNGFEHVISEEINDEYPVSQADIDAVIRIINPIFVDKQKLQDFTGFYDIEHELERVGIDRTKAIRIFTFLNIEGRFVGLIKKMDSSNSPGECRRFQPYDYEK